MFVCFHQLSVTMNNNKVEGCNRGKTITKQKLKEKFTPFDDDVKTLRRHLLCYKEERKWKYIKQVIYY